jgi:protein-S-isoprenylcysteine O-methyltransferase Ste14
MSGLAFPKLAEHSNSRMEPDVFDFGAVVVVMVFVVVVVVVVVNVVVVGVVVFVKVAFVVRRSLVVLLFLLVLVLVLLLLGCLKVALDFWTLGDSDLDRDLFAK